MHLPDMDVTRLDARTVPQLRQLCKNLGIKGYSKLDKRTLVEKIKTRVAAAGAATPANSTPRVAAEQIFQTAAVLVSAARIVGPASSSASTSAASSSLTQLEGKTTDSLSPSIVSAPGSALSPTKIPVVQQNLIVTLEALSPNPSTRPEIVSKAAAAASDSVFKPDSLDTTRKRIFVDAFPSFSAPPEPSSENIVKRTKLHQLTFASSTTASGSKSFDSSSDSSATTLDVAQRFKVPTLPTVANAAVTTASVALSSTKAAALSQKKSFPTERTPSCFVPLTSAPQLLTLSPLAVDHQPTETTPQLIDLPTLFACSFLPRLFIHLGLPHRTALSSLVTKSHCTQLDTTVIIRFLLAKGWYAVNSLDFARAAVWMDSTILDAREVLPCEVWSITQRTESGAEEKLLVLFETCEVIGRVDDTAHPSSATASTSMSYPVRADWLALITQMDPASRPIFDRIAWHNGEECDRGISKLFLRRVGAQSEELRVARRYVLAHVAANSVSGSYKTARQMADEFAGELALAPIKAPKHIVNLFLAEHHYVESISFTTSAHPHRPLHSALAAVQTPHRELIVLRETGLVVGCEEDGGVGEVWMQLVGCDTRGIVS